MTYEEFLSAEHATFSPPLRALWFDAHGDWTRAHEIVQAESSREAAWVHAYLHRREGDAGNARYWYARAGRPEATGLLDAEREAIARALLESRPAVRPRAGTRATGGC